MRQTALAATITLVAVTGAIAAPHNYYASRCSEAPLRVELGTDKNGVFVWNGTPTEWPIFVSYLNDVSKQQSQGQNFLFELQNWHGQKTLEKKVIAALKQLGIVSHPECSSPLVIP